MTSWGGISTKHAILPSIQSLNYDSSHKKRAGWWDSENIDLEKLHIVNALKSFTNVDDMIASSAENHSRYSAPSLHYTNPKYSNSRDIADDVEKSRENSKLFKNQNDQATSIITESQFAATKEPTPLKDPVLKTKRKFKREFKVDNGLQDIKETTNEIEGEIEGKIQNTSNSIKNHEKLVKLFNTRNFQAALTFICKVFSKTAPHSAEMSLSFQDLIYIVSKYWFLDSINITPFDHLHTLSILKDHIEPRIKEETIIDNGSRSEWFSKDYLLLTEMYELQIGSITNTSRGNQYAAFNMDLALNQIWSSVLDFESGLQSPLYTRVLAKHFSNNTKDIETIKEIECIIPISQESEDIKLPAAEITTKFPAVETKSNRNSIVSDRKSEISTVSRSQQRQTELDRVLSTLSSNNETSNFALSEISGPSLVYIRAIDVTYKKGEIIAATGGGQDRGDRKISIWNLRNGTRIKELDNQTTKSIVFLLFHPTNSELLISIDMEFDVKLWNWKESNIIKSWKKLHSRIIYQGMFITGNSTRFATCSADQTLKIWNIDEDEPRFYSCHANEPFTSFVICGNSSNDAANQQLVASLFYSLRIYNMKTLVLSHSIHLKELKADKTPITLISLHPSKENFILISSDNRIRLFDIDTETTLMAYTARELSPGTRIDGRFSPCGSFIYSASYDIRTYSGLKKQRKEFDIQRFEANGVLIWKCKGNKLEKSEMNAMADGLLRNGSNVLPATQCRWINFKSKSGKNRKALIVVSLDQSIQLFL